MRKRWLFLVPLAIAGFALFIAIGGQVVMQLWNWLLPPLFGWPSVTFWQALGLLGLCRILFGGFGGGRCHHSRTRRQMAERWERMSPEEREKLGGWLHRRRGHVPPADPDPGAGR